jgi:hypothetical protein
MAEDLEAYANAWTDKFVDTNLHPTWRLGFYN